MCIVAIISLGGMCIRVTISQPSSEFASHSISIFLDGEYKGNIGLDGVLTFETDHSPYTVKVICGEYSAAFPGIGDEILELRWVLKEPYIMFVRKGK